MTKPDVCQAQQRLLSGSPGHRALPENWTREPLKGKLDIAHGYAFEGRYFGTFGAHLLTTPGHFHEAGGFRDIGGKQKYYSGPVPTDYVLEAGDLIVAMTEQADGLLGSAALVPETGRYLHNQRLGRVRPIGERTSARFLYYLFNSPAYREKVRETAAGTKVKYTSPEKLLEIPVALPPPAEQRAIAAALSDVDALIGALDRLIAKKRDLKQAAMQQLLTGQTRFPEFVITNGRRQTEMGNVPDDWDVCSLEKLDPLVTSGSRGWAEFYSEHGDAFVRITNLSRESIYVDCSDLKFVRLPDSATEGLRTQLRDGDLLISITADIGIIGFVDESVPKPSYINQHIALVRFDPTRVSRAHGSASTQVEARTARAECCAFGE